MTPLSFLEMICINFRGGHAVDKSGVQEMGYSAEEKDYQYAVTCEFCKRTSMITRKLLSDGQDKSQ